jgi:hypothetical protein
VTDHRDQLRDAFETHEDLAPDPAAVYARVQDLARGYRRRRRGAQAAGGALLGAGLIAGAVNLPALLAGAPQGNPTVVTAGGPATTASPQPGVSQSVTPSLPSLSSMSAAQLQPYWDAYFNAGYGNDEAVALAHIWHMNDNSTGKAEAGRRLLAGETLPVQPNPQSPHNVIPLESVQVDEFHAAGYTYDDAVKLAALWNLPDPYHAKIEGGKRLMAGQTLPIKP